MTTNQTDAERRDVAPRENVTDGLLLNAQQFSAWIRQGQIPPPDVDHALRCATYAAELGRALAPDLDLTDIDVTIVTVAALLHDVGYHRSARDHHRKTWDAVLRMRLDGLTWEEQRLAALAARFHGTDSPSIGHAGFEDLEFEEQRRCRRHVALVKLAVALDASHLGHVERVSIERRDGVPHVIAHANVESAVERDRLRDASHQYARITHRPLTSELRVTSTLATPDVRADTDAMPTAIESDEES